MDVYVCCNSQSSVDVPACWRDFLPKVCLVFVVVVARLNNSRKSCCVADFLACILSC